MKTRPVLLALLLLFSSTLACADELLIAAAADLRFALQEIADSFQKQTGNRVRLSFGSSGNLFNHIQNGAPYDLFFSADADYPRKLQLSGLAEPGSLYEYASGRLVLWVPQQSPLNLAQGMRVLLDTRIRKIAIANPAHAPYGRAAQAAMRNAGIYDGVKHKFVLGENISQTAEFVQTGNADIGLIALSLALSPNMKSRGRFLEVPTASYPPIQQAVVVLKSSRKKAVAGQFLQFLRSQHSTEVLRQYGFTVPGHVSTK